MCAAMEPFEAALEYCSDMAEEEEDERDEEDRLGDGWRSVEGRGAEVVLEMMVPSIEGLLYRFREREAG